MSLLNNEPTIFPPDLLSDLGQDAGDREWWALHAKPRQEKSLARQLFERRAAFYLPLFTKTFVYRGRRRKSHLPLFPGYVFMFGDQHDRAYGLSTNRVVRALPVPNAMELRQDLAQIAQLIASEVPLSIEGRFTEGRRVRVRNGPFLGIEGVVLERRSESRLLIEVRFLQQAVSVQVEDFILEPLD